MVVTVNIYRYCVRKWVTK